MKCKGVLVTLAIAGGLYFVADHAAAFSQSTRRLSPGTLYDERDLWNCKANSSCDNPDENGKYQVLLIGDSHSTRYRSSIYKWSKSHNLVFMTRQEGLGDMVGKNHIEVSKKYSKYIEKMAAENDIKIVFIAFYTAFFANSPEIRIGIENIIDGLNRKNIKVSLLGQVPMLGSDPRIYFNIPKLRRFVGNDAYPSILAIDTVKDYEQKLCKKYSILYVNPYQYISSIESLVYGNKFMFFDSNHLSFAGVELLDKIMEDSFYEEIDSYFNI